MVLIVVLELLGADGLSKVEGQRVEHVLLGVRKGGVLGDRGAGELGVTNGGGHDCVLDE